jgi:formylglycine-generating enzyme required for sulfatase activity
VAPFDAAKAKEHQEGWAKHLGVPVELTNSIGMKLLLIPPGEFDMGSPKELIEEELKTAHDWYKEHLPDDGPRHHVRITQPFYLGVYHVTAEGWYKEHLPAEGPQHRVRITRPFYLGTYLVTQGEYERVMWKNPSEFSANGKQKDKVAGQDTKRLPVECVSWGDCVEFCRKLSALPAEKAAGRWYRLPSEAQWEHACRAGSNGRYSFSPINRTIPREYDEHGLEDYGWFGNNSNGMPHAVGLKCANGWGLYDMHGNVWQWCQDWHEGHYDTNSPKDDPGGPSGGSLRVNRGGAWSDPAGFCRCAYRPRGDPGYCFSARGFRACLVRAEK